MRVVSHFVDNGAVLFGYNLQLPSVSPPKSGPSVTPVRGADSSRRQRLLWSSRKEQSRWSRKIRVQISPPALTRLLSLASKLAFLSLSFLIPKMALPPGLRSIKQLICVCKVLYQNRGSMRVVTQFYSPLLSPVF